MAHQSTSTTSDMTGSQHGSEGIRDYREQASRMGQRALDRTQEYTSEGRRMVRRSTSSMRDMITDYPMASLLTTATVAFALGAMWSGSSRSRMRNGWMGRSTLDSWLDSLQHYAEPGMKAIGREANRWR